MAFGTLAAYFVIVAEWFAKSANDKNDLRKLVPLYFLGVAICGSAGAVYSSSILPAQPHFRFIVVSVSLIAGVLLAAAYWRSPNHATGDRIDLRAARGVAFQRHRAAMGASERADEVVRSL